MTHFDVAIVGAGIAGAGLAYSLLQLAPGLRIAILEAESRPGYHTTGRSAAFYAETYGGPLVQPLTSASKAFLQHPPVGFIETPILSPRGALHICPPDAVETLDRLEAEFRAGRVACHRMDANQIAGMVPQLRPEWRQAALFEPGCMDIDVAALHQAYLRAAQRAGAVLLTDARVVQLGRDAGGWRLAVCNAEVSADKVANAAGAWASELAMMAEACPVPIRPLRRTLVVAEVVPPATANLPLVLDASETLYFKPENGHLWISPHDETPDVAGDVRPDELDVARAMDRFQQICDWPVQRLVTKWAGLRNFAPDRLPVYGADPIRPGFFWCAGQGGWGIQTAPAASMLAAATMLGVPLPAEYAFVDPKAYLASRFG